MIRPIQPDHPDPQRRRRRQIKPTPGKILRVSPRRVRVRRRHHLEPRAQRRRHQLHWTLSPPQDASAAPRAAPPRRQSPSQRPDIETAPNPHRLRHVIARRPALQTVQKPQPRLRIRQRQGAAMANPATTAAPPPPPPPKPRPARSDPTASDARTPPEPRPQHPAKPAAATPTASPAASTPQGKKIILPTDPVHPQQIPPRLRHNPFDTVSRRPVPHRTQPRPTRLQPRQRRAVDLPARRHRQPLQPHHHRRHQVLRQHPPQMPPQPRRVPAPHRVAHQTVAPRHHRRLPRQPAPYHRRLDLSRLDPVTPHLHLAVAPPDILSTPSHRRRATSPVR